MSNTKKIKVKNLNWVNAAMFDERARNDVPKMQEEGYSDDWIMGFYTGMLMVQEVPDIILGQKLRFLENLSEHKHS